MITPSSVGGGKRLLDPLDDLGHLLVGVDEAGAADLGVQQLAARNAHLKVARLAGVLNPGYNSPERVNFPVTPFPIV